MGNSLKESTGNKQNSLSGKTTNPYVLPTGSGNKVIATPANGSSGVSALRALVALDIAGLASAAWAALTGNLTETQVIPFDGPTPGTADTGISRFGAASLAIGNGTAGDFSGSLKLTNLIEGTYALNANLNAGLTAEFYPEAYGAYGDNSHDDTTALQACINAAIANGGGTVRLGAKTYKTTAGLTLTNGWNVNIIGVNQGVSIIACNSATASILTVTGNGGTTINFSTFQDFTLLRSVAPTPASVSSSSGNGLAWLNCLYVNVIRVGSWDSICNFYQDGCANVNYEHCISHTVLGTYYTGHGFFYNGGSNSSRNIDCLIDNNSGVSPYYGVYIDGTNGLHDLYFAGMETALCDIGVYIISGLHTDGGGNPTSANNQNIQFIRCIHDQPTTTYSINNVYGQCAFISIIGGYISAGGNSGDNPQVLINNSSGVTITGVQIRGGEGSLGTTPVISITGAHSTANAVEGCVLQIAVTGTYITLNGCSGNVIANNVLYGNATYPFTTGISLLSASYNTIYGNNISGYGITGITLDASSSYNQGSNVANTTHITTALTDAGTYNSVTATTTLLLLGSDTGISRLGAASLAVGNGTAGDYSGNLKLTSINGTVGTDADANLTIGATNIFAKGNQIEVGNRGSIGYVTIDTPSDANTGFIQLFGGSGTRTGFFGYSQNSLYYQSDDARATPHEFSTDLLLHGNIYFTVTAPTLSGALAAADAGISHLGAASLAVGNGTAGDASGQLKVAVRINTGFTVASLPSTAATGKVEGAVAYATNGLKPTETTGNGTGVPVFYSAAGPAGAGWYVYPGLTLVAS